MFIALGLIIFVIGCCLSSYEDTSYNNQVLADKRHKELMRVLDECNQEVAPREERRARRRVAKDKDGNVLTEEVVEEIIR